LLLFQCFCLENLFFKSTYLLKSFGELSVEPEIAFTNNKPTFLEFFAEGCEVCKEMAPQVSAFKDEYEKDINFEYRFSSFQNNDLAIIGAKLHFEPNGNLEKLFQTTKNNLKLKTETQPYHQPSFGSVFKNPKNNYAAKLIDDMGLKGFKIGGAEISTMHSNFIINTSSASSKDIFELIKVIQQKVLQNKGIFLQPEVRMIGFDYPN